MRATDKTKREKIPGGAKKVIIIIKGISVEAVISLFRCDVIIFSFGGRAETPLSFLIVKQRLKIPLSAKIRP